MTEETQKTILPNKIIYERLENCPNLEKLGRDLTYLAHTGHLAPVIGRDKEILQLVRTLSRKTKANPMLIGAAGVGKTAIAEGLADKITKSDSDMPLFGKRIIEISLLSLIAVQYRGEFEERLIGIIKECKTNPDVILFIDEIHTIIGAGAAAGGTDAANMLKPALARGEISCIAATTDEDFAKYFAKDPAINRRFQPIRICEPSCQDTLEILRQIRSVYETHHRCKISDTALEAAVKLTVRYISDRKLPDKAIDVLDSACARARIPTLNISRDIDSKIPQVNVTEEDVSAIISDWTGVPITRLTENESTRFQHMEENIKKNIIGQDTAVDKLCKSLKMARAGLKEPDRPVGVFLLTGPTGVGKTELAKALADFLFNSENEIIRLDMSEFSEEVSVTKLLGSSPGYVGYQEEGQLSGQLRRKPYSVVLLDEIEKANIRIFDLLLQVFDAGRLTDSQGRTISAKDAIFILTSNIGGKLLNKEQLGFKSTPYKNESELGQEITAQLNATFRPEFLNRLDDVIVFDNLKPKDLERISMKLLDDLKKKLDEKGISLRVDKDVPAFVSIRGNTALYGARPLRKTIDNLISKPISEMIISAQIESGDNMTISIENNELRLNKLPSEKKWILLN
jgi:ATP-dependent Clp protease ATP-binding subunit ClpC